MLVLLVAWTGGPVWAQNYTNEELDTLVGPIALYPDPLLTNVLVASTHPDQVQAAYDYVVRDSHPDVSGQGWDPAVKAVCSYTDVLTDLGTSPDWVSGLGWAVTNQQQDVMDAVQRFRFQAQSAGNLTTNDKMLVLEEGTTIRLESASPEVIYVPTYDPVVVTQPYYDDDDDFGEAFLWGAGIATSAYLWSNVFDWHGGCFYNPPGGWFPGAGYYGAYGARGAFNGGNVWAPSRNTNINRPVNINNIKIGSGNRNRVSTRPAGGRNGVGDRNGVGGRNGVGDRNGVGGRNGVGDRNGVGGRGGVGDRNGVGGRGGVGNRPAVSPAPRPSLTPNSPGRGVGSRPPVASPRSSAGNRASVGNRAGAGSRASTANRGGGSRARSSSRSGLGSYSSSGATARQSNRGARSRGSGSLSSGGRPSSGRASGRSGGRSSGARSGGGRSGGGRSGGGGRRR
jgi:hypothetical protein